MSNETEKCPLGCGEDECRQPQPCFLSGDLRQRREARDAQKEGRPAQWPLKGKR